MMKRDLVLFGAGQQGRKVIETVVELGFRIQGFISQDQPGTEVKEYRVLGYLDYYFQHAELKKSAIHIAIGDNGNRYNVYTQLEIKWGSRVELHSCMAAIVSPCSSVSASAKLGAGGYIGKRAVILNDVKMGVCCLADTGAIIEHDVEIGDFATISPGAILCGEVKLGRGVIIGAGAVVAEGLVIGENALIGAGSVVVHDIPSNCVAVGNPARVIRSRCFGDRYLGTRRGKLQMFRNDATSRK